MKELYFNLDHDISSLTYVDSVTREHNTLGFGYKENVNIVSRVLKHTGIEANYFTPANGSLVYYDTDVKPQTLELKLYIGAETRGKLLSLESEIIYLLQGETMLHFSDEECTYKCVYNDNSKEIITPKNIILTVTFSCQRTGFEIAKSFTGNTSYELHLGGTKQAEPIITITPITDLNSFTINDITINNLTANTPIVINSQDKTVKQGDTNKFIDTDLIEFPKLKVGNNTFSVSDSTATIEIKYNWLYV